MLLVFTAGGVPVFDAVLLLSTTGGLTVLDPVLLLSNTGGLTVLVTVLLLSATGRSSRLMLRDVKRDSRISKEFSSLTCLRSSIISLAI